MSTQIIELTPYKAISNKQYGNAVIKITKELFNDIEFINGRSTFYFEHCYFDSLLIEADEDIDSKKFPAVGSLKEDAVLSL